MFVSGLSEDSNQGEDADDRIIFKSQQCVVMLAQQSFDLLRPAIAGAHPYYFRREAKPETKIAEIYVFSHNYQIVGAGVLAHYFVVSLIEADVINVERVWIKIG